MSVSKTVTRAPEGTPPDAPLQVDQTPRGGPRGPLAQPAASTHLRLRGALLGLFVGAFALRVWLVGEQSAYMDESTFILTGRTLIEEHAIYAGAPTWTYGSYLWALIAGLADMAGGLSLVRGLTSLFGAVMALGTALIAAQLAPPTASGPRRWGAALLAGLIMAVFPTAIAVGRFGTYDALAGAAFMSGVTLLVMLRGNWPRLGLLAAAALLFVAFLAKYLVAVFIPFVCLGVMLLPRSRPVLVRSLTWLVLPLGGLCALYFLAFQDSLEKLLAFSTTYTDLQSNTPLREYLWQRLELWALAALAVVGCRWASGLGRLIGLGGAGIIVGFQALARPDFDFWKHSIYLIFFLAPLAGLALVRLAEVMLTARGEGARSPAEWRADGLALAAVAILVVGVPRALEESSRLVTFYPDLNPSLAAIQTHTAQARTVLTDDSTVRYYLYPRLPTERVTDPYFVDYRGLGGFEGYRRAVTDRHYDAIVLDGGIGPQGRRLRSNFGELILRYYDQVYSRAAPNGMTIEIYRPREGRIPPPRRPGPIRT